MLIDCSRTTCRAAAGWRSHGRCRCSALAFAPFLFPGSKALGAAAKMLVFVAAGGQLRPPARLHRHRQLRAHDVLRHRRLRRGHRQHAASSPLFGAHRDRLAGGVGDLARAVAGDRIVQPAREGDLLRDDHAGGRGGVPDAGLAAVGLHRRRRRAQASRTCRFLSPSFEPFDAPISAPRSTASSSPTTCCSLRWWFLFLAAAAHRQLAVRSRAAGDPRERPPRRGDRLPHGGVSHAEQRDRRPSSPRWPARCSRCGCVTPAPTRR